MVESAADLVNLPALRGKLSSWPGTSFVCPNDIVGSGWMFTNPLLGLSLEGKNRQEEEEEGRKKQSIVDLPTTLWIERFKRIKPGKDFLHFLPPEERPRAGEYPAHALTQLQQTLPKEDLDPESKERVE